MNNKSGNGRNLIWMRHSIIIKISTPALKPFEKTSNPKVLQKQKDPLKLEHHIHSFGFGINKQNIAGAFQFRLRSSDFDDRRQLKHDTNGVV